MVRPLVRADRLALEAALASLSDRSRYARFMSPRRSLPAEEIEFLLAGDGRDHVALAAWTGGRMVAEARLIRTAAGAGEIALAVIDPLQRRGIGTLLIDRLLQAGRDRGLARLIGHVLVDNQPMLRLLRKLGAKIGLPSLGVYTTELAIA